MTVKFGQRKALGRQYAIDPAYQLASEELALKYDKNDQLAQLAISRASLDETIRKNTLANERAGEQISANRQAGITGTIGNVAMGGPMLYMTGKNAGWWGTKAAPLTTTTTPAVAPSLGTGASLTPGAPANGLALSGGTTTANPAFASGLAETGGGTAAAMEGTTLVNPALIDSGTGLATAEATTATTAVATPTTAVGTSEAGVSSGMLGTAATYAPAVGAGAVGGAIGSSLGEKIGDSIGVGGQRERRVVGGAAGGAAAGAAVGSIVPGIGTAVGAVIGGIVGAISGGTWICTAVANAIGIDKEDQTALFELRKFSLRNHAGWLHWYLDEGKKIVEGMEKVTPPEHWQKMYEALKRDFVLPVTALVKKGEMEEAYTYYLNFSRVLCALYAPDVEIKEHDTVIERDAVQC